MKRHVDDDDDDDDLHSISSAVLQRFDNFASSKVTATLGGIARGNDRGNAAVIAAVIAADMSAVNWRVPCAIGCK